MVLLHEKRLDNTVNPGKLGIGEVVEVRSLMGTPITAGEVVGSTPFGVIIKESEAAHNFYASNLYLFAVVEQEVQNKVMNVLTDLSPDERVELKMRGMAETGDPQSDGSGGTAKPMDKNDDDDRKDDEEEDDGKEEPPKKKTKKGDKPEEPVGDDDAAAAPDSSIDVDELPDDIRRAIIDSDQMDEGQLNGVLGEISDAAMKGLKRAGVKETQIFNIVQQIQNSSYEILTGKKSEGNPKGKKKGK